MEDPSRKSARRPVDREGEPAVGHVGARLEGVGAAVAVAGWAQTSGRMRRWGIVVAVLAAALMVLRLPSYRADVSSERGQTTFVQRQHDTLVDVLNRPRARAAFRRCPFITVPNHRTVPLVRHMLDAAEGHVVASNLRGSRPRTGLLLVAVAPRFSKTQGTVDPAKWWVNLQMPG